MSRIAVSDCEAFHDGLFVQPVNTISSLGYAFVGTWLLIRGWRRPRGQRLYTSVLGASLVLVGAAAVAFHGPQYSGSRWLHDWSIATAVLFVATYDVGIAQGWSTRKMMPVYLGGVTGVGIVLAAAPRSSEPVIGALAVLTIAAEIYLHRAVDLPLPARRTRLAYGVASAAFTAGVAMALLGRTGAPLCDPDSLLQGHAAWHLLGAIAAGAFAVPFLERDTAVAPAGLDR